MNDLIISNSTPNAQVDFDRLIERRNALVGTEVEGHEVPNYWLLPEVKKIIDAVGQVPSRHYDSLYKRLLLNTLWRTGGRAGEVIDRLKPRDIQLIGDHYAITLHTLKKRAKKVHPTRTIEVANDQYIANMLGYIEGAKIAAATPIFTVSQKMSNNWIKAAADIAGLNPENASNHTFRHSFAINYILQADSSRGNTLLALQTLMGHSMIESTMHYLKILSIDLESGTGSMQW